MTTPTTPPAPEKCVCGRVRDEHASNPPKQCFFEFQVAFCWCMDYTPAPVAPVAPGDADHDSYAIGYGLGRADGIREATDAALLIVANRCSCQYRSLDDCMAHVHQIRGELIVKLSALLDPPAAPKEGKP